MEPNREIKKNFQQQDNKRKKGDMAEQLTADYLIERGYTIVEKNFHYGKIGEIDLIASQGEYLVFVEVKARTNASYGSPLESITASKQRTIRKVAEFYLYINKITDRACRFDVAAVDMTLDAPRIDHIENAF